MENRLAGVAKTLFIVLNLKTKAIFAGMFKKVSEVLETYPIKL